LLFKSQLQNRMYALSVEKYLVLTQVQNVSSLYIALSGNAVPLSAI
jgi:hypothetical protein